MKLEIVEQDNYLVHPSNQAERMGLADYIDLAREDYNRDHDPDYSIPFEDEELVWAIQEWYGMMGCFSKGELKFLKDEYGFEDYDLEFLLGDD